MLKKLLTFCLIFYALPAFAGDTVRGGISLDFNNQNPETEKIQKSLPLMEKGFIDLNYSVNFKPLALLGADEVKISKSIYHPHIETPMQYTPDSYEVSLSTGRAEGQIDSSRKLEMMLKRNPDNKELLFAYAIQLKNEKEYGRALEIVNKAISQDPDYALSHFLKGDILRNMGEYKEAVGEYLYTTQINPYCADAYYNVAKILELLDDRELALDYYKTAYQANPNDNEIRDIILQHYIDL